MTFHTFITDIISVLIAGLILGAGLPALFALGIRLAAGPGHTNPDGSVTHTRNANIAEKIGAYLCFVLVALAIILGILWITQKVIYQYTGIAIFGTSALDS